MDTLDWILIGGALALVVVVVLGVVVYRSVRTMD